MAMKVAIFICFIMSFIFSSVSNTTTTGSINWWCTQTPHYETCNHYVVESNISAATTVSINQFLDMTVKAAIDEARVVLKRAQEIEVNYPNAPGKSLWGSCVDFFDGIVFTLNMVLDHTDDEPSPLDVHTWLSAGLTYINMCGKGFEMINITNTIVPTITTNLTQLLLNSLAIFVAIRGSDSPEMHEWDFSNRYALLGLVANSADVVVAQDGSGNFTTVQEAVNSAGKRGGKRYVIYVKSGVYKGQVIIPQYVKLFGDGINKTIITGDQHLGGDTPGTTKAGDLKASATFRKYINSFLSNFFP